MKIYGANDLRGRFPELKPLNDTALVPLLGVVIAKFIEDISQNFVSYGLSGIDQIEQFSYPNTLHDVFGGVMTDGSMIKITVKRSNVYFIDGDSSCYVCSSVVFDAGKLEKSASGLKRKMQKFLEKMRLEEIKMEAMIALNNLRRDRLKPEIVKFYFK